MEEVNFSEIKKAQKGDKKIFERIITVYRQRITELCYRYMRNTDEAVDIAQEVFCKAYAELKSFEFKSKVSTWLYRITVNICLNRRTFLKRRRFFETGSLTADEEDNERQVDVKDTNQLADEEMETKETRAVIMAEVDNLEPEEKSVVILRDIEGMEYEEMAKILKMPVGSVKSKLWRAREKLRKRLMEKLGDK